MKKSGAFLAFYLVGMTIITVIAHAATPKMPTFFARRDYPNALRSSPVQVGDTNGDGILDVIADGMGFITVYSATGTGLSGQVPAPKRSSLVLTVPMHSLPKT